MELSKLKKIIVALAIIFYSFPSLAELPLTVENLLSGQSKLRSEFSINYLNSEKNGIDTSEPIVIQTGENSFFSIPTQIGEKSNNTDAWVVTTGLRYGLTEDLEIYGRVSGIIVDSRSIDSQSNIIQNTDSRFADSWLGINYRFHNDLDRPAWLGFAEIQVAEKQPTDDIEYGKSALVGFTTYQTYDPIVLSLTSSMQLNNTRRSNNNFQPGHRFIINPSLGFAVNDKVTLNSGIHWLMQQKNKSDGQRNSIRKTRTSIDLGLAYAASKNNMININTRSSVSGEEGVQIRVNWLHKF